MNDELRKRVIEDLERSGFGSEMRALQIFLAREWRAHGNNTFMDRDEEKTREYDLHAYRPLTYKLPNGEHISNFFHIIAEVKKSDKPWVVIKAPALNEYELNDAWVNLVSYDYLPVDPRELIPQLSQDSLINQTKWKGLGIHESFKPPENLSRWYGAFISVCKAAEHVLKIETWESKEKKPLDRIKPDIMQNPTHLVFVKPVVIFDGILLSTQLASDGAILLEEIQAAPFSFDFRSANYNNLLRYKVDLVTDVTQ